MTYLPATSGSTTFNGNTCYVLIRDCAFVNPDTLYDSSLARIHPPPTHMFTKVLLGKGLHLNNEFIVQFK